MKKILSICTVLVLMSLLNCKDDTINANNFVPSGPVSLVINTDLPEYYYLKSPGTHIYQPGGNRGVILIHDFDGKYVAIERTCSYEPDKTCAKMYVDSSALTLRCGGYNLGKWENCCESRFIFSGQVSQGPAQFPLRTYNVSVNGSTISINN